MGTTDRDKLYAAFRYFNSTDVLAFHENTCCANCGWAYVHKIGFTGGDNVVFYHVQNVEDLYDPVLPGMFRKGQGLWLQWIGDGAHIVEGLKKAGFRVEWNGDPGKTIACFSSKKKPTLPAKYFEPDEPPAPRVKKYLIKVIRR